MKRLSYVLGVTAVITGLLLLTPGQAHAYLDPGSGSYIFQLLLAALVGALFAIRIYWGRIKSFFQKLLSKETGESEDEG
jgi:membrane protease YdiL (CAAX protease family)